MSDELIKELKDKGLFLPIIPKITKLEHSLLGFELINNIESIFIFLLVFFN